MTTPLPNWTLEEVEATLLRLVTGSDQVMVSHLCQGIRETLPFLTPQATLLELLAVMAATLQSVPPWSPISASRPGEASMN